MPLLTVPKNRHNGSNSNGTISPPPTTTATTTAAAAAVAAAKLNNNRSNKTNSSSHNTSNSDNKRAQFWLWILCGVVCSFLSIDYSLRSLLYSAAPPASSLAPSGSVSLLRGAPPHHHHHHQLDTDDPTSIQSVSAESILMPLQATQFDPTTDNDYAFDSTAVMAQEDQQQQQQQQQQQSDPNQHAILIPYRDRKFHLELFLEYMQPYLQYHFPDAHFTLWIMEQDDSELFNRAWLANVGLREIVKHAPQTSCVVFHDVDLVPNITSHVPYTTCQYPMQLGSELQHFNWSVPYPAYCGGITSLSLKHWQLINGIGNDYIGWGGEDDDLYHRLRINGLLLESTDNKSPPQPRRPQKGHGIFRTLTQKAEHHVQTKNHNQYWKTLELLKKMYENSDRWKYDGMNDVYYTITGNQITVPEMGFQQVRHIKAIPQKPRKGGNQYPKLDAEKDATTAKDKASNKPLAILEQVHVPYTGGQAITAAAAKAGVVWGACHYAPFIEWNCPIGKSGDFAQSTFKYEASFQEAQRPWQIPLSRFTENPMEGTKRFTVVRHPYSRAISFYRYVYDAQHGYPYGYKYHEFVQDKNYPPQHVAEYIIEREHPDKLNAFLQDYFYQHHHPHPPMPFELIPQVQFVYSRGVKYVHHVLHYEFLQRDFNNLMDKYLMKDKIELPPPDRKRKRKKAVVKTYHEKRRPQPTQKWLSSAAVFSPLTKLFGQQQPQEQQEDDNNNKEKEPVVVDMSLAEIEDEYLLGAQDLADATIAMLNEHFELDFKKFHYAKIKVNTTTDEFWNKIQVIPRESAVAKQQAERNEMLKRQQNGAAPPNKPAAAATGAAPGKPPAAVGEVKAIPRETKKEGHHGTTIILKEDKHGVAKDIAKEEDGAAASDKEDHDSNEEEEEGHANENGVDNHNNNNENENDSENNIVDNLKKHAELQQQRQEQEEENAASDEGKDQKSDKEEDDRDKISQAQE